RMAAARSMDWIGPDTFCPHKPDSPGAQPPPERSLTLPNDFRYCRKGRSWVREIGSKERCLPAFSRLKGITQRAPDSHANPVGRSGVRSGCVLSCPPFVLLGAE